MASGRLSYYKSKAASKLQRKLFFINNLAPLEYTRYRTILQNTALLHSGNIGHLARQSRGPVGKK